MSESIKVSVILTSYNHAKYLREAIASVLGQTFAEFELIIWDDCSSDNSWEIIQEYSDPRIRAFRNEERKRGVWGINKAIAEISSGKYIAIHHSDDIWEPEKLEKQVRFLDENPQIGAVFTRAHVIGEDGQLFEGRSHFYFEIFDQPNRSRYEWLNYFFYHGNALCHPSVLIRKLCYDECGPYRYGFAQIPDLDMWVRLCLKYEIHVLGDKLVRFRVRADEMNASGNRPEVRVRWPFEFLEILKNFRNIKTPEHFVRVFPLAERYTRQEGFDADFALGMICVETGTFGVAQLFGLELLLDALNDPERAARINEVYKFTPQDLIALTAKHDVFSTQWIASLTAQLSAIVTSRSWQVALLLQRARAALAPQRSFRAHMAHKVFDFVRALQAVPELRLIRKSSLFNGEWYSAHNPDVAQSGTDPARHYALIGGLEGRDPGPQFSGNWYLTQYPEVRAAGMNPLVHYLKYGQSEGRATQPKPVQPNQSIRQP